MVWTQKLPTSLDDKPSAKLWGMKKYRYKVLQFILIVFRDYTLTEIS